MFKDILIDGWIILMFLMIIFGFVAMLIKYLILDNDNSYQKEYYSNQKVWSPDISKVFVNEDQIKNDRLRVALFKGVVIEGNENQIQKMVKHPTVGHVDTRY